MTQSTATSQLNERITLTAFITGIDSEVAFDEGGVTLGKVVPTNGVCTFSIVPRGAGSHTYRAEYGGAVASIDHFVVGTSTKTTVVTSQPRVACKPAGDFDDGG